MDIPTNKWKNEKKYSVNDIVEVGNLAVPESGGARDSSGNLVTPIADAQEALLTVEDGFVISIESTEDAHLSASQEIKVGSMFSVNPKLNYSIAGMVRKGSPSSDTIDPYKTLIKQKASTDDPGVSIIDPATSIGVGVGIKFYKSEGGEVGVPDFRATHRLMASSELSSKEYYNVQLDIESTSIPSEASRASLVVFVYGLKGESSFYFKQVAATTSNRFFYCIQDNNSTLTNKPNGLGGAPYWTQDFVWRPGYGSKADFVAINDKLGMGEGADYVANLAINSLPLQLDIQFDNRSDKEARAIIHFLQEKFFPYESIFGLDYKGNRLLSSDVGHFNFKYTYPYREDLKFTCTSFNHTKTYRNNNNISATFVCNTESTLRNVESHEGYNTRLDALIPTFVDKTTTFKKGIQVKLNTYSLEEDAATLLSNILEISRYPEVASEPISGGMISFSVPPELLEGDCINIDIPDSYNSIFDVGKTKITKKLSNTEFVFADIKPEGSSASIGPIKLIQVEAGELLETDVNEQVLTTVDQSGANPAVVKKLTRCPEDCLSNAVRLPKGITKITSKFLDPDTGKERPRIVYTKLYRKLQLDSDITAETGTILVTPLETFTVDSKEDFQILIPAVRGRSSIYLKDPNELLKYPWIEVRNFDHKPSLSFSWEETPIHVQSSFIEYYKHEYKKQVNQNLTTVNLVFDKRSDTEAAEILQFLEAHLGCQKFRFQMPRPYLKDDDYTTTQTRPYQSTFFCPSWSHDVIYKNNHTITATFIESVSSPEEDLRSVFGIGRKEKKPCVGGEIYDPITTHDLCTYSSVLEVALGSGFQVVDGKKTMSARSKSVDLIFIVDASGSMTMQSFNVGGRGYQKYGAALDVVLKMITVIEDYIMPGTQSYNGNFEAPGLEFGGDPSGDASLPPWPISLVKPDGSRKSLANFSSLIAELYNAEEGAEGNSSENGLSPLYNKLKSNGYNLDNLDRFKIKIDQKRVNIGLIIMGNPGWGRPGSRTAVDVSDYSDSFDKLQAYKKIKNYQRYASFGENYPQAISMALAQLYNSPRAQHVTDRIIINLSDAQASNDGQFTGSRSFHGDFYNPPSLAMCGALRRNGELAKRRPTNKVLASYGYKSFSPITYMEGYKKIDKGEGKSALINPDYTVKGKSNPKWYEEKLPTVYIAATVGVPGRISRFAKNYVYDYDGPAPYTTPPTKKPQFYFPITDGGINSKELERLIDLIKVVEMLTTDSGYQNIFSITVHNCGPHDVTLLNTLVNVKSQPSPMEWTTEILKAGIPKGGNASQLQFTQPGEGVSSIKGGYGGQYYNDQKNQDLFGDSDEPSNILWESFNTKYEVYRAGELATIGGGWENNSSSTQGVRNVGVAFKGMPVRVFKADSGLEIIDYNIGNAVIQNEYKGDYSHLPKLKPGEDIDLFFGVRTKNLSDFGEGIQLVINSDDGTSKKMDCYGNINFDLTLPSSKESKPREDKEDEIKGELKGCEIIMAGESKPTLCEWMLDNGFIDRIYPQKVPTDKISIDAKGRTNNNAGQLFGVPNSFSPVPGQFGNLTARGLKLYLSKDMAQIFGGEVLRGKYIQGVTPPYYFAGKSIFPKQDENEGNYWGQWLYKVGYLFDWGEILEKSPSNTVTAIWGIDNNWANIFETGFSARYPDSTKDSWYSKGGQVRQCGDLMTYVIHDFVTSHALVSNWPALPTSFLTRAQGEIGKILRGEQWDEYDIDEKKYFGIMGPKPSQG